MSATGLSSSSSSPSKLFRKPIFRHGNDSEELDVFEAAKYFSGYNEPIPPHYTTYKNRSSFPARAPSSSGRMSLDMPMANMNNDQLQHHQTLKEKKNFVSNINGKPYKQPSSPGGRLASFLNALFNQTGGRRSKKKPPKSAQGEGEEEEEEESPCGSGARRKRRSSISYFTRSFASTTSSKSGFRSTTTPPPPLCTPTKAGFTTVVCGRDDKLRLATLSNDGRGCDAKAKVGGGNDHGDDGGEESDSSSDLFELQNYDLDVDSSGLPVYETTDVGSIRSGNSSHVNDVR